MKIALYYPWIYLKSGVERTILELTIRSKHQWTIFTSHFDPDSTYPEFKKIRVVELNKVPVKRSYHKVLEAATTILFQKIDLKNYDMLLVHSEGLGDLITFRNHEIPVICYCYTPMKVIHDPFMRLEYLKKHKFKIPLFFILSSLFKFFDKLAWRKYQYIFCMSREVKNRILKAKLASAEKIEVLAPGVDTEKMRPSWIYDKYFFHPTRIKWWKNVELSIEAFKEFQDRYPKFKEMRLIIAGQVHKNSKKYYQELIELARDCIQIQIIPNPSDELFQRLFQNCSAVLNTTSNEDGGLVPVEAMSYGKPVVAVNRGGPAESIINTKTGFLVESAPCAFAKTMNELSSNKNLVLDIGKQARERAKEYDWANIVKRFDRYFDSFLLAR